MFISRAYALSYITWIIFYDRDAKELVIMQPQLNMERLLSLIFVRERLKRVLSSKKQFSCRAFCLENFQNYIVGSCGCQATAKSDGFLQKSIENTTIEKNFKYLRPQTLITLSSIESCGSPHPPPPPPFLFTRTHHHHHHHQSLFIHEIVSLYMVFLGIVFIKLD